VLTRIDGVPMCAEVPPGAALVHKAGTEVELVLQRGDDEPRRLRVRTVASTTRIEYRDWVERNRARVHAETDGRCGYVHVPDMGSVGFSEFHRYFLVECERPALLVDVRANGGGHVSGLLLDKLVRTRLAYVHSRWGSPEAYPNNAVAGPQVLLTDEKAGSDGDIFTHSFKLKQLGPVIGKRTWGGVIGINPRDRLVDGTIITQPEYAFWFVDKGFGVENWGSEPDIEVDIAPHDYKAGRDPQLDRGLAEILRLLERNPGTPPDFGPLPSLAPPKLR
jgi:tricorn protease